MIPSFTLDKARPLNPYQPCLLPAIYITCVLGSILAPAKLRAITVSTALLFLFCQIPKATCGLPLQDYLLPTQAGFFLIQWADFYVFPPSESPRRIKDKGNFPHAWWGKLGWSSDLFLNQRGVGWNWQVKNVPESVPVGTPKWAFVHTELSKAIMWFLLADISQYPLSTFDPDSQPDLWTHTFSRRMIFVSFYPVNSYYLFNLQHSLLSALTVALGIYKPEAWPPIMGKLKDVLTVRDFWSKFWHQLWRRKIGLPFRVLTKYITIKRGTHLSKYLQLYLGFMVSSWLHILGAWNLPTSSNYNNISLLAFFMLQPVAITFEDFIIYLGKRAGAKKSWKTELVGRIWTFAWFAFSLRYICVFTYNSGAFGEYPLPSLIPGLARRLEGFSEATGLNEL